jgi:hypothetical protein
VSGVDVLPRLGVLAAVDEAEVAVRVLLELLAVPGVGAGRQVLLDPAPELGVFGVIVEEGVPFEL